MPNKDSRARSIFSTILVPMILLVLIEALLFAGILLVSGVLPRLTQNDRDIVNQQISSRKDYLENYLVGTVGNLTDLSDAINKQVDSLLASGDLDINLLDSDAKQASAVLNPIMDNMVSTLRDKSASGIFVIFNTHDLSSQMASGAFGQRTGAYILDQDPDATPSARNEDLQFERAPADVVQSFRITTDRNWKPLYDFVGVEPGSKEYDFFSLPFQTAYVQEGSKNARDYAFWGIVPLLGSGNQDHCLSYTVPLILADGTVYGVVGVDLSADYLQTFLPASELFGGVEADYILASFSDSDVGDGGTGHLQLHPVVTSGSASVEGTTFGDVMNVSRSTTGGFAYDTSGKNYYVGASEFKLYDSNSPFEDGHWVLAGLLPDAQLHQFSDRIRWMILFSTLLMMLTGIIGSVLVGRSISNPVKKLAAEVANAQAEPQRTTVPTLSQTGIEEVDNLTGAIMTLSQDIASTKQLEQQRLEYERDYDLLTGLMNRRAFYREANKVFSTPEKLKHGAIVMLDIDNLKEINDMYGHDWGDKYTRASARCFEEAVPPNVLVARVSGDEFYLLFYGYDTQEEIEERIESLRQTIPATSFTFPDGKKGTINASGGVAYYPNDAEEFANLMRLADFTMYQVKAAGKNNIAAFDIDTYQRETKALQATAELEDLLNDFGLADYHYQPIFDARTGKPYAYEALMRVSMEALKNPGDVLTYARQERRLMDIERLTWNRTLETYSALLSNGQVEENAFVFINTFAHLSLGEAELADLAEKYAHLMPRIVIEITEAENMDEDATAIKRDIPGISGLFALDDYGSGYNSEIMLLELKPKFVKVDISIIRDIDTSADKQRIVSQIVEYAHERDMLIIAEGIETAAELSTILALGVDLLQGFFLSRPAAVPQPMSAEGLQQLLNALSAEQGGGSSELAEKQDDERAR